MTAVTIWSTVTIIGYFMENPYGWLVTRFLAGASSLAYNTVSDVYRLGIQVRNMKMFFYIYGTWRWVTFEKLMIFFIR